MNEYWTHWARADLVVETSGQSLGIPSEEQEHQEMAGET